MSDGTQALRVVVLMSTYNGERFIAEQLHSILEQLLPTDRILIRDDGSHDGTIERIAAIADPRITLTRGSNLGFGRSFLTLLASAPTDLDMLMFADQDDVWLPGKVGRAWRHLAPLAATPALYGSAQWLVDETLRPLQRTASWPRGPSFAGALTENIITGCTAAMNRLAVALLQRAGIPSEVRFHDWWLYLVISAFGTVVHDDEPTLLYRQHGRNHIGHGAGWLGRQWQIVRFLGRHDWVGILLAQVHALRCNYGAALPPDAAALVNRYFAMAGGRALPRWRLVFSLRRWRHWGHAEVALRVLLALHRLQLWPPRSRRL